MGEFLALASLVLAVVAGVGAGVFALMRHLDGSFGRVFMKLDETRKELLDYVVTVEKDLGRATEANDRRLDALERAWASHVAKCAMRHRADEEGE